MLPSREKLCYRPGKSAVALGLCLLATGCAGEHLFRAQDRKIEELRLERARQDEALGRTREIIDQLREEWKNFAARENSASKESAALQAAIRKLAQRLEESDGKRGKIEERLHLAETKSTELNQSFTQVSSMLKAAEGDLIALRSSRAAAGFPPSGPAAVSVGVAGSGREGGGRPPGEANAAGEASRGPTAVGSFVDGMFSGRGSSAIVFGALLLAAGILVALVCVYIGSKIRPSGAGRTAEREKENAKPKKQAQAAEPAAPAEPASVAEAEPTPPAKAVDPPPAAPAASRVPAAPARLVFPTDGVEDFFEAAESASTRFSKSTKKPAQVDERSPTEPMIQNTQVIETVTSDELSNTDLLPVPRQDSPEEPETVVVSVNRGLHPSRKSSETGAQTEILDDAAPGNTQVIGEDEQPTRSLKGLRSAPATHDGVDDAEPASTQVISEDEQPTRSPKVPRSTPSTRELLGVKQTPRSAASAIQKKTRAPDEKDLLDELENIIGYKMGEKSG